MTPSTAVPATIISMVAVAMMCSTDSLDKIISKVVLTMTSSMVVATMTSLGQQGNDQLYGEADNDRLNGGLGDDLLNGGAARHLISIALVKVLTGSSMKTRSAPSSSITRAWSVVFVGKALQPIHG